VCCHTEIRRWSRDLIQLLRLSLFFFKAHFVHRTVRQAHVDSVIHVWFLSDLGLLFTHHSAEYVCSNKVKAIYVCAKLLLHTFYEPKPKLFSMPHAQTVLWADLGSHSGTGIGTWQLFQLCDCGRCCMLSSGLRMTDRRHQLCCPSRWHKQCLLCAQAVHSPVCVATSQCGQQNSHGTSWCS